MKVLILLALAAYTQAIAPGDKVCSYCSDPCNANQSVLTSFDGMRVHITEEQKTTIFEGQDAILGDLDSCKAHIHCVTTKETYWNLGYKYLHLDWCGISLGVNYNPASGGHRNWIVGQTLQHIGERGQGLSGISIIPLPAVYPGLGPAPLHTPACTPQQEAHVVNNSIEIASACCNWAVRWTPRVGCTCLEIFMDKSWAGASTGMCGNADGDADNDWDNCGRTCTPGDEACLTAACEGGSHNGQSFIGGTRIREHTLDGNPPPNACF